MRRVALQALVELACVGPVRTYRYHVRPLLDLSAVKDGRLRGRRSHEHVAPPDALADRVLGPRVYFERPRASPRDGLTLGSTAREDLHFLDPVKLADDPVDLLGGLAALVAACAY